LLRILASFNSFVFGSGLFNDTVGVSDKQRRLIRRLMNAEVQTMYNEAIVSHSEVMFRQLFGWSEEDYGKLQSM